MNPATALRRAMRQIRRDFRKLPDDEKKTVIEVLEEERKELANRAKKRAAPLKAAPKVAAPKTAPKKKREKTARKKRGS